MSRLRGRDVRREDAWRVGMSHDFGRCGPRELGFSANSVGGDKLWLRAKGAYVDQDERTGRDDFSDFRIIVNYSFGLPRGGR